MTGGMAAVCAAMSMWFDAEHGGTQHRHATGPLKLNRKIKTDAGLLHPWGCWERIWKGQHRSLSRDMFPRGLK